jgi:hypothetical protein
MFPASGEETVREEDHFLPGPALRAGRSWPGSVQEDAVREKHGFSRDGFVIGAEGDL